jgi:hypothetical protein
MFPSMAARCFRMPFRRNGGAQTDMEMSHVLSALVVCAALTGAVGAFASSDDGAPPVRDSSTVAGSANHRDSTQASSGRGGGTKARGAESVVAARRGGRVLRPPAVQVARGNADHLHAPLSVQPRGRPAQELSRPGGSNRALPGGLAVRRSSAVNPAGKPNLTVSNSAARATKNPLTLPKGSILGGSAITRTAHNSAISGTQLHRMRQPH